MDARTIVIIISIAIGVAGGFIDRYDITRK